MKPKSKLIQPSTRAFFQEADQTPEYSFFDRVHGYVYARWPYLYIGLGKGNHPVARKLNPIWQVISTN